MVTITIYGIWTTDSTDGYGTIKAYAATREIAEEMSKHYHDEWNLDPIKTDDQHIRPLKLHCSDEMAECFLKNQQINNVTKSDIKDDSFVLVEASKLSLEDDFLQYEPQTKAQEEFKKNLTSAIKSGVKDFYRPIYDPSVDENGNIVFVAGKRPDVGHSYNWWVEAAKKYVSNRKIRLGTKNEYVAFLGVLIKKLIASGWSAEDAWYVVCDDSKMLGHYWNSENAKHDFEETGSREVCGFFDLANTCKILARDDETGGFWLASGLCNHYSCKYPLADLGFCYNRVSVSNYGVGWYVL